MSDPSRRAVVARPAGRPAAPLRRALIPPRTTPTINHTALLIAADVSRRRGWSAGPGSALGSRDARSRPPRDLPVGLCPVDGLGRLSLPRPLPSAPFSWLVLSD